MSTLREHILTILAVYGFALLVYALCIILPF